MATPRKPTALVLVENGGKLPRKRHRERAAREPRPTIGLREPPSYLTPDQTALWADLVAVSPAGLFCQVDSDAFETYVVLVDMQRQCLRTLNGEHGGSPLVPTGQGLKRSHMVSVALKEYKHLAAMLRTWQNDFGFSPAARMKVQIVPVPPKSPPDPLARFIVKPPPT